MDLKNLNIMEIKNLLFKNPSGESMIFANLDSILQKDDNQKLHIICSYVYTQKNNLLIWEDKLKNNNNPHIRALFIEIIIQNYEEEYLRIFPNILEFINTSDKQFQEEDLSYIASLLINRGYTDNYNLLKEYILKNYSLNSLSSYLLINEKELLKDIDRFFLTSKTEKMKLFLKYESLLKDSVKKDFKNTIEKYNYQKYLPEFMKIFNYGLGDRFLYFTNKYLEKSINKDTEYVGAGSTCICFRIGDYVIKLINFKWSYENIICPRNYLILPNLEEEYVRDDNNIVVCGLEVQKYLKREIKEEEYIYVNQFYQEFSKNNLRLLDKLIGGLNGDNCRILDSYLDADIEDKNELPAWFKIFPLVLIDHDLVFDKEEKEIKYMRTRG